MSPSRRQALVSEIGEFQLIQTLARGFSVPGPPPLIGMGDDAAILAHPSSAHLVISTDLLVEDIHFSAQTSSFFDIGYKAAVANLSDIAAMGATATYILVAVALPSHMRYEDWKELYRGLSVPCKTHGVQLVGGDTSASRSSLFLAITILGQIEPGHALTRGGAKEGDIIYVSGSLGNSAAGLVCLTNQPSGEKLSTLRQPMKFLAGRHLRPSPRIALGRVLSSGRLASAALDVSDGLSGDIAHLCQQSRVGALIQAANLPMSPHLIAYASRVKADPLLWALHGGEEYELLFTVSPKKQHRLELAVKHLRVPVTAIGVITSRRSGLQITHQDGRTHKLVPQSYVHFSKE
ncbi:MAG TPA: thiamine-phosphate kinase [Nitrospirales bacterium]|nr:thiamine-phosphate kinase [Nitrospiraceae bacterium]HNP27573.1 thiamine-phosphate kinase [Nitrospirales bacterium]